MQPTVSIVMPVYNVEAYVAESIASVQAQTWVAWELIVVNDGSTDNSEGIVRSLALEDSRIRLLSEQNSGTAIARNRGLDMVRGDFLVFLDGDDLWRNDFLEIALATMDGTRTDFFLCGADRLHPDRSRTPMAMEIPHETSSSVELIKRYFAGKAYLLMGNVVLRTIQGIKDLRFAEGCRHAEDTEYLLRALSMVHSASFLEEPLFLYRIRPGSATQKPWDWRIQMDGLRAMERVLEHMLEHVQGCGRGMIEEEFWRIRFSKYRFLYKMVKSRAWSDTHTLLAQGEWQEALAFVKAQGSRAHRVKVRIIQSRNTLLWGLISLYTRCRSASSIKA